MGPYGGSYGHPSPTPPPARPNTRRNNQLAFLGGLLVATLLIATVVLVHGVLNSNDSSGQASTAITIPPPANSGGSSSTGSSGSGSSGNSGSSGSTGPSLSTDQISAAVEPGVVDINTRLGYQSAAAAGTGMVLTSNGYVLTNNHVIDGATSISATVVGTGRSYTATVVGTDVSEDVAVLRLSGASGLTTIPLGDSTTVSTGDRVVAIGNAGGTGGDPTVVTGSVTALNQSIVASDENGTNAEQLHGLIVTDAPIVAGDSGGPLANSQGKVIGMDTAASANNQFMSANNTGFAIPINRALSIAKQIEQGNESDTIHIGATGFLGVAIQPSANGTGANGSNGSSSPSSTPAVVSTVIAGSPADKAGIVAGDTITGFNGSQVASAEDLTTLTHRHHPGDKVSITWTDQAGQSHEATVTLVTGPAA
jgi:S1-C subfamily serine protease